MARPRRAGLTYFPHDVELSSDEKVAALESLYGNDGYAFYCKLLERIYRTPNCELDMSYREMREVFATKCNVTLERFEEMLATAVSPWCDAFDGVAYSERHVLTSDGIKDRVKLVEDRRDARRKCLVCRKRQSDCICEEVPRVDPQVIKDKWNAFAKVHGLPAVEVLNEKRKRGIAIRFSESGFDFDKVLEEIAVSDSLRGRLTGFDWKGATFDWIFLWPGNWVKVLEGNYRKKTAKQESVKDEVIVEGSDSFNTFQQYLIKSVGWKFPSEFQIEKLASGKWKFKGVAISQHYASYMQRAPWKRGS